MQNRTRVRGGWRTTRIIEEHNKSLRSGEHHYYQHETSKLLGTSRYGGTEHTFTGGYDNKYRKLRGIGEYTKPKDAQSRRRQQSKTGESSRVDGQGLSDKGEYP